MLPLNSNKVFNHIPIDEDGAESSNSNDENTKDECQNPTNQTVDGSETMDTTSISFLSPLELMATQHALQARTSQRIRSANGEKVVVPPPGATLVIPPGATVRHVWRELLD